MSPKTIQHYVLKCLNTEEVKACTKVLKTKNSSLLHPHVEFVIMEQYVYQKNINYVPDYFSGLSRALLCIFPTTFLEIAVYVCFESAENTPNIFFAYKKNFHSVSGSVSSPDGTIFKYESKLTCCN